MPEALRQRLRQSLIARYAQLRQRLERAIGSREDADDALQEAWVQLEGINKSIAIKNDEAYLLGMATHIALRSHRSRLALLNAVELDLLAHMADDTYDTARLALARIQLDEMIELLRSLPGRRRAIFISVRVHGLSYEDIAQQLGVSVALVNKEMNLALKVLRQYQARQETAGGRHGVLRKQRSGD